MRGFLTTRNVRRYFNCGAFLGQTVCMLLAAFLLDAVLSVLFISIGLGFAAFAYSAFTVNYLDIAPQFAGILNGICNSFATVAGIITPLLTGFIVPNGTEAEWKVVFYIAAGIYLCGCVVYWIFCQGTLQEWAVESEEPKAKEEGDSPYAYKNEAIDMKYE